MNKPAKIVIATVVSSVIVYDAWANLHNLKLIEKLNARIKDKNELITYLVSKLEENDTPLNEFDRIVIQNLVK